MVLRTEATAPLIEGIFTATQTGALSLAGTRCTKCSAAAFPPRRSCLSCRSLDVVPADLGTTGTVFSFARADMAMPGYEPGHLFGMVDLDSGPRIYAQFEGLGYDEIAIGDRVELAVGPIRRTDDGRVLTGPRFRPAPAPSSSP